MAPACAEAVSRHRSDVDGFVAAIGASASGPRRFEYDAENRLAAVRDFDGVLLQSIGYDALGRRIGRILSMRDDGMDDRDECKALRIEAQRLLRRFDADGVIALLEAPAQRFPGVSYFQRSLGLAYLWRGDFEKSAAHLQKAFELDPWPVLQVWRAHALYAAGAKEEAKDILGRVLAETGELDAALLLGKIARWSDCDDEAIAYFEQVLRAEPKNKEALFEMGMTLLDRDDARALQYMEAAIEVAPNYVPALVEASWTAVTLGRLSEAESYADRALSLEPTNVRAHWHRGYVYERTRRRRKAEKEYRKALELNPNDAISNFLLGENLRQRGQYAEALLLFERTLELDPSHERAPCSIAAILKEWRGE